MKKIGITGGIGSGKSTICKVFESFGVPVYYADQEAKNIYSKNKDLKDKVIDLFGNDIYLQSGEINREKLAEIVFSDKNKLEALNRIVHPAVAEDFNNWCSNQEKNNSYIIKEAALLIESGSYKQLDYLFYVSAPLEERINRVVKRDNTSAVNVKARINNQKSEKENISYADLVLLNDNNTLLLPELIAIHKRMVNKKGLS